MKQLVIILSVLCLLSMESCYIQRYSQKKKQVEAFSKEMSKVRSKNAKLKQERQSKLDSIALFVHKSMVMQKETMRADSMIEVYTQQIRNQLGSDIWGDSVKRAANTAATTAYMSEEEKDVLYWLNLARLHPDLYAELYISPHLCLYKYYKGRIGSPYDDHIKTHITYINTCYIFMAKHDARAALVPDEANYKSAECHAIESGKTGYVGHDRTNCTQNFSAECCEYGSSEGYSVIHNLLLDVDVPGLGHRRACLATYHNIGISVQPHLTYGVNTVLDFD